MFPINFKKWTDMPKPYLDHCWDNDIKPRFCFKTNENIAGRYVLQSIGKKWVASRLRIWNEFYDPLKSRDELISNALEGIGRDQWATYVDYRLKLETQALCKKNGENRKKQIVSHIGGSKSYARRRHEMEMEYGHPVGCGHLFLATHKHQDGSWVNDTANEQGVLGKENPGQVRCMGLGVTPTSSFGNTSLRLRGLGSFSSNGESCNPQNDDRLVQLELQLKKAMSAFKTYILFKEGQMPDKLASIFDPPPPQVQYDAGSQHEPITSLMGRSSSASNQDHNKAPH